MMTKPYPWVSWYFHQNSSQLLGQIRLEYKGWRSWWLFCELTRRRSIQPQTGSKAAGRDASPFRMLSQRVCWVMWWLPPGVGPALKALNSAWRFRPSRGNVRVRQSNTYTAWNETKTCWKSAFPSEWVLSIDLYYWIEPCLFAAVHRDVHAGTIVMHWVAAVPVEDRQKSG